MSKRVYFNIININSMYAMLPLIFHLIQILKDPIGNKRKFFDVSSLEGYQLTSAF